ncbi:MAG: dephospho-CoA kinase [Candidatus Binataceae bacterium]
MITIGITGGIGSGKSTVAKILAELGAPTLDADKVAHAAYAPGAPAYDAVVDAFGEQILAADRTIDRRKLGPLVFADPSQLTKLTSIVWPATFARMKQLVAEMRAGGERRPIVIEAAVLIEAKWQPLFDEVWLVTTSVERVIARVERDRGLKRAETEARIRAQLSDDERRPHASLEITNDGTVEELRAKVATLWKAAVARSPKS